MKIDAEKLLEYIGQVGDDLVVESETAVIKAQYVRTRVYRWGSLAAVLVLGAFIAGFYLLFPVNRNNETMMLYDGSLYGGSVPAPMMAAPEISMADNAVPLPDAGTPGGGNEDMDISNESGPGHESRTGARDTVPFGQTEPFVTEEGGVLAVYGFGGWISFHPGNDNNIPWLYFAGTFPVAQLENENIEGTANITQDTLNVNFNIAMNAAIYERTGLAHGTLEGPAVIFEYKEGEGIMDMTLRPYVFDNTEHEPLTFNFTEASAYAFAQLLREAVRLADDYRNP
jgi:hypothetical protein